MSRWLRRVPDRDEVAGEAFRVPRKVLKKFLKEKRNKRKDPGVKDGDINVSSLFKVSGRWSHTLKVGDM